MKYLIRASLSIHYFETCADLKQGLIHTPGFCKFPKKLMAMDADKLLEFAEIGEINSHGAKNILKYSCFN